MDKHYIYIKELQATEHSRRITDQVIDYIEDDPDKFSALMELFFSEDWLINQRAAWPIPDIAKKYPELIEPYISKLIHNLEKPCHNAVIRNTVRLFENIDVPEDLQGIFYDICYKLMCNIKEPVANKIFAMTVMYKIGEPYPELLSELKTIIETQLPYEKPGFKSRGRKTLALINKKLNTIS